MAQQKCCCNGAYKLVQRYKSCLAKGDTVLEDMRNASDKDITD